jgi:hypothetical protein
LSGFEQVMPGKTIIQTGLEPSFPLFPCFALGVVVAFSVVYSVLIEFNGELILK